MTYNNKTKAQLSGMNSGRAKVLSVSTFVGLFASISAIAAVSSTSLKQTETEITRQISIVQNQEDIVRASYKLNALITPRTGAEWKRAAFPVATNPVLRKQTMFDKRPPLPLNYSTIALIEDARAYGELSLGLAPKVATSPKKRGQASWQCLAEAVYFEARSETERAQRAVAEVILNRVDSRRFPDTVCDVINQGAHKKHRCQFSYNCDGVPESIREPRAWSRAMKIAKEMVVAETRPLTRGATHYHASYVRPFWSRQLTRTARYGSHIFYREGTRISQR